MNVTQFSIQVDVSERREPIHTTTRLVRHVHIKILPLDEDCPQGSLMAASRFAERIRRMFLDMPTEAIVEIEGKGVKG